MSVSPLPPLPLLSKDGSSGAEACLRHGHELADHCVSSQVGETAACRMSRVVS